MPIPQRRIDSYDIETSVSDDTILIANKNGKTINIEFSSIPNYIQENISYITNEEIDVLFNKGEWINATRFYFKPKWTRPFIE